ncbi:phage tail tape measure protein [Shewanella psychrotolerans]|uniref:phage tail tape measure protein n=1 Tax=Shewanella psychrotolerans TaxID=2864206 RepID=UPI0021AC1B64|nr:phage tail tape measure protein [Shewanella psychrotolerans]
MSLPAPLMFTVGLVDQITKPIAKISKQFNGLASNYQAGTMQMASGIGGIAASGYALQNALMPAIEMDRVLGEVKSLGVRDSALKQLTDTSYEYALKYGKSATEFVSSSYDIQSAIAGLSDADLSQFTLSSNVLAAATKADAATITNYMGTMYGIFKNQANDMGKGAWVEQVTGMTATAVQAFKTKGSEMSSAFTSIGAQATSAGIAMSEQMAILGTLQSTMSGSEAGTKYKAFLAGVGKAQDALNLSFTDSHGAMLPMVDILNQIKGKYGDTLDVAEGDALAKAFGSQEAVATVKLLMADIDGLGASIDTLGKVKGMTKAEEMAAAMTDQSERLSQSWYVIRAAFGSAVLPAFNQFVGWIADMGKDVLWFTQKFPNLTRVMGYAAIAILGLVAAGGAFTVMMGMGKMAMTAYGVGAMAWAGINAMLTSGLASLRAVMLAVNIAMYANPIGMIVGAVVLAIAAVGALVYYWDDLVATISNWEWVQSLVSVFSNAWQSLKGMFIDYLNWYIDKLNYIPGVEIDLIPTMGDVDKAELAAAMPDVLKNHNAQSVPKWMQQQPVANDAVSYIYSNEPANSSYVKQSIDMQRNMPAPYQPEAVTQQQHLQLVKPATYVPEPIRQSIDMQRNMPAPYQPEAVTQQQHLQLVKPAPYVPEPIRQSIDMQRNMPAPYPPEALAQQINVKPLHNVKLGQMIKPNVDKSLSAAAQSQRTSTAEQTKQINFGDVIIHNPPQNFSLAEIADQQEMMTG